MPFVIDDAAMVAGEVTAEVAEEVITESVETVSEEMIETEFDPSNFEYNFSECKGTTEIDSQEISNNIEDSEICIEDEFDPKNFQPIESLDIQGTYESESNPSPDDLTEDYGTHEGAKSEEIKETDKEYDVTQIKTINSPLEGQNHPVTDVPFERKVVTTETGEKVEGVFPQFESTFDCQLPKDLEMASDADQFNECNKQLKEKFDADPSFRDQFIERQKENIENGETPYGYTWHHNEETGKMQLVDYDTHQKTAHTGGRFIWGGGSENR